MRLTGTGVLDTLVGVLEIAAYLRTEAHSGLLLVLGRLLGFAFFFFEPGQPGLEHLQRDGPILVLAPLVLALDDDAGGQVGNPHGACGLVHVLAAGTAGAVGFHLEIVFVDFDFLAVGDLGRNVHGGKRRLPLAVGVEGTDPHQAMDAGFSLQVAVSHRAANGHRGAVDAGFFVVLAVQQFDLVAAILGPLDVHPQQHLGPIVGVGAAVAGVDGEDGPFVVVRTAEQGLGFQLDHLPLQRSQFLLQLAFQRGVLLGQFEQLLHGVEPLGHFLQRFDHPLQGLQLRNVGLGPFRVVPEVGLGHALLEFFQLSLLSSQVKESPGAEARGREAVRSFPAGDGSSQAPTTKQ